MGRVCPSCHEESPATAKFCHECGTPFARACPSCGTAVGASKFCPECGVPLGAGAPAAPPPVTAPVSERRTTTVLFGDLVSFTTLSESRDPEEVRELLSAYFAAARTIVRRYGGTIEKFIGDAVMAVWGVPVGHEDDAERAVRAGLDLVTEVAALGASVGAPELSMRVGVVTGSVAVTLGAEGEGMVAGDAVNTAARVQTAATPGAVWVDAETRGLTAAAIAFSDMGEHLLKGKTEPATLYRADAVVAAVGGAQRVDGLEAPMTGRDPELRAVKELFHATQADGRPRLAMVTGVAGIGKSRLGWEYEKYTDGLSDGVRWHRGRCLSYGDGVAFWAFAEMMRSRLGITEDQSRAEVDEQVRTRVAALALDVEEASWLAPRLLALVGRGDRALFDRTDLFVAWTTFLDRVAGDQPLVLLLEDVHHADPALLDLVEHLLATTRAKLFVLLLARPELLEARPGLRTHRRGTVVELRPLPDPVMAALVDGLVADLPDDARTAVVGRADGIPLYAVETVRALIDRDVVVPRAGRYVFDPAAAVDLAQLSAPTSLRTLIAARLDALTPAERRAVQDASVLGLAFTADGLRALSDRPEHETDLALAGLVRKAVVEHETDPLTGETGSYRFQQAMVREVAYDTIARRDRRARHLAVADHLAAEELAETLAGVIAQHLLDALAASTDADPDRTALEERAADLLERSAARAVSLGSGSEALRSLQVALTLGPAPVPAARLEAAAADAARMSGQLALAEAHGQRAIAAYDELGLESELVGAMHVRARVLLLGGRSAEAYEAAAAALARAERVEGIDAVLVSTVHGLLASINRNVRDPSVAEHHVLRQLVMAERSGDDSALAHGLIDLGIMLEARGCPVTRDTVFDKALAVVRGAHQHAARVRLLNNMVSTTYPADLLRAVELADEVAESAQQLGDAYQSEIMMINVGYTWRLSGAWDRVELELGAWLSDRDPSPLAAASWLSVATVARARGALLDVPDLPGSDDPYDNLASALLAVTASGEVASPAQLAEVAQRCREQYGDDAAADLEDLELLWAPAVELHLAAGDVATAGDLIDLVDATDRPHALGRAESARIRGLLALARGEDPETPLRTAEAEHASYGAPFLLARTRLELGRWLHAQGRRDEAHPLLSAAREAFVVLRAFPSISEVDAVAVAETAGARS